MFGLMMRIFLIDVDGKLLSLPLPPLSIFLPVFIQTRVNGTMSSPLHEISVPFSTKTNTQPYCCFLELETCVLPFWSSWRLIYHLLLG